MCRKYFNIALTFKEISSEVYTFLFSSSGSWRNITYRKHIGGFADEARKVQVPSFMQQKLFSVSRGEEHVGPQQLWLISHTGFNHLLITTSVKLHNNTHACSQVLSTTSPFTHEVPRQTGTLPMQEMARPFAYVWLHLHFSCNNNSMCAPVSARKRTSEHGL